MSVLSVFVVYVSSGCVSVSVFDHPLEHYVHMCLDPHYRAVVINRNRGEDVHASSGGRFGAAICD